MTDDQEIVEFLARHEKKELLRFVTVGSVDDGKSTLIGRLLHDAQGVYEDQLAAVRKASTKRGFAVGEADASDDEAEDSDEVDFSLFTDGLVAEREQGITIDVAYRYFATERRKFILADTPGHVQYTRNMATGASTADVAVILLDARLGVLPQSRRHAFIASLLGIPSLVVAVNKMDLAGWDSAVYDRLVAEFGAFASGLGFRKVQYLPVCARKGDNVVRRSRRMPWYTGETLLEFLETVPVPRDRAEAPLRFPVQLVLRPNLDYRGFAGSVASGSVRAGDAVTVLPSGRRSTVRSIDGYDGERPLAEAPEAVVLRLADEVDIARGDMLVTAGSLPVVTDRFVATLVWMSEVPLDRHRRYLVKHTTRTVPARVERVLGRIDLETLGEVHADSLALNDIGRCVLRCERPLFVDPYVANRSTGAFIVVDALTNDTVASGMVAPEPAAPARDDDLRYQSPIDPAERRAVAGQSGALVWIERSHDPTLALALAAALERSLFARGCWVTVVEAHSNMVVLATRGCIDAGVVTLCLVEGASRDALTLAQRDLGDDRVIALRATPDPTAPVVHLSALSEVGSVARAVMDLLDARGITRR